MDPATKVKYKKLASKYCNKNKGACPICNTTGKSVIGKNGKSYLGCFNYPTCKGMRFGDGTIVINQALIDYLNYRESLVNTVTNYLKIPEGPKPILLGRFIDIE